MRIRFFGDLQCYDDTDLDVGNLRQLLAGLKHVHGHKLADTLLNTPYRYVLINSANPEGAVAIMPGLESMGFEGFDQLLIVPEVDGETGLEIGAAVAAWAGATGAVATAIAVAVEIVIAVAMSIAISAVMNLLSPTPEFDKDPAAAQKLDSALFNGAPNIREQGGSVPLIYGKPHCGGVLISSGLSTEEKTV